MATENFQDPIEDMEHSDMEEEVLQEEQRQQGQQQPPNDPNHPANRLTILERIVQGMTVQYNADQQTINELRGMVNQLQQNVIPPLGQPAVINNPAGPRQKDPGEIIRPTMPTPFEGDPKKIQAFFTDMRAYFRYFPSTMAADEMRVRVAGGRLEGAAKDWFEPHLRDFERNTPLGRKAFTNALFASYNELETQLKNLFGEEDEKKEAENALLKLSQKGACSKYTAEFVRLSAKTDLEDASKRMLYYQGLKSDVKDDLAREDIPTTFETLSQKATRIDNRQFERRLERQREKKGETKHFQKAFNHANQGKKRDDYVAKDNGTRPGRMDIDAINHKKFKGTCNSCGKPGHKEADCRSKQTCGFCGKKGHQETYCYSKKNGRNPEAIKDKARVDAITEVPHKHLSWTACYDDSCLIHKSSKEGSGYYPKKSRARKSHETVRIDTLDFYEPSGEGDSDFSEESICEHCGSIDATHECEGKRIATWKENYECDNCHSRDYDHECMGCPDCGSMEGYQHSCEGEWRRNMEAMYEIFEEEDRLAKEYLEEREKHEQDELVNRQRHLYQCETCKSSDINHECQGCGTCGSWEPRHDCSKILDTLVKKHRKQEERRQYLEEHPPVQINLPMFTKIDVSHAYDYITLPRSYKPSGSGIMERYDLDEDCGQDNWKSCGISYCGIHVYDKLENWHNQIEDQLLKNKCTKEHFLDCADIHCKEHAMKKYRFQLLTKTLTKKGYNTINHTDKGQGNKTLIKEFHSMIEERIYDIKCKWCYKYQGKTWRESHLGRINIDSIGHNKKLLVKGYINQSPVTTYVDSGADRNLITPQLVNLLGLPYAKKKQPTYVSSVATPNAETTINYETDHLPITIAGHTETIKFDIMPLDTCDVLLGHPWLKQSNPLINWKTEKILWETDVTQEL